MGAMHYEWQPAGDQGNLMMCLTAALRWIRFRMWRHWTLVRVLILVLAAAFALWNLWLPRQMGPQHVEHRHSKVREHSIDHQTGSEDQRALLLYMSRNLVVKYKVVSNIARQYQYQGRITLLNGGSKTIPAGVDWNLYVNHLAGWFEPDKIPRERSVQVANLSLQLSHVNGMLFKFSPTRSFTGLKPGAAIVYNFISGGRILNHYQVLPNWYVAGDGLEAYVVESTQDVMWFVEPFVTPAQWKSSKVDRYDPYTPQKRYSLYEIEDMKHAPHLILPTPVQLTRLDKSTLPLTQSWVVTSDERSKDKALYLADKLQLKYVSQPSQSQYIALSLWNVELNLPNKQDLYMKEAYNLSVSATEGRVLIQAKTEAGLFYGIQSYLSLMANRDDMPVVQVIDAPRFEHRGLMLDVARHFLPVAEVVRVLDVMAMYKMNRLHLHLTDDEGWRLEIPGLPELTQVGGCRNHTLTEQECLLPGLGSGADGRNFSCGFYKVSEYKAILRHADRLHIKVVPEVDMPSHSHAAIKAMEARYTKLLRAGSTSQASTYLLSDLGDHSVYYSVQKWKDCVINPCMESSYTFIEHVMSALVNMHEDVQPLTGLHFGGDEIPKDSLTDSPVCKRFKKSEPLLQGQFDYFSYFVKKISTIAKKYKLKLYGWQDAFYGSVNGKQVPLSRDESDEYVAMAWQTSWDTGRPHQPYELANAGYKVVLAPANIFYLDQPQEPHPEEIGLPWATRFSDTKKVFNFLPDNFYENIDEEFSGKPLDPDIACSTTIKCPKLNHPKNIIGLEGALWTELVDNMDKLHHQLFPRLLALAERAWHKAAWESETERKKMHFQRQEDWEQFANTLGYKELLRLDDLGIAYYLPPPGAKYENQQLKVNSGFPGLDLQFRGGQGDPWQNLHSHAQIPPSVDIATKSFDGKRRSRSIHMNLLD